MKAFLRRHFIDPIIGLLSQGITPRQLALSLAFGIGLGIFPVLGTTTVLCTVMALAWRLNRVAIHTVHFAITPVQLLLTIPFVRVGERVVQAPPQSPSMDARLELITASAGHAIVVLWGAIVHAVIGWVAIGPVAIYLLYRALTPILKHAALTLRPRAADESQV